MRKDIAIYIIITIIVLSTIIYLTKNYAKSKVLPTPPINTSKIPVIPKNTITIQNKTNTTTTSPSNTITKENKTTTSFTCTVSPNETQPILNGNFSTGTYYGWITTGAGFGTAPLNITQLNKEGDYYGEPWHNYGDDNFMATTFEKGIAIAPGNLTSLPFLNREYYLNFKMISPQNGQIYVEILRNNVPVEKAYFDTYNASGGGQTAFENVSIPVSQFLCQNISVRVVFNLAGTSETNYVAVTGFYLSKVPVLTKGVLIAYDFLNSTTGS